MDAKAGTRGESKANKQVQAPDYGRSVRLPDTAASAGLERAKNAFGREGFGVVAEIDFRDTFVRKLDKDIGPYWVVEICNPMLADRALLLDRTAGLLMPCKVAVWQDGKDAVVAALRPEVLTAMTGNEALGLIAREAEQRIERALVRLEGAEPQPRAADIV
jgi:uncharacterized protein (DUF302 family)